MTDEHNSKSEGVNDGRLFEERVFGLLQLQGVQALRRESQFSSKKIDLYFETELFGSRRRFAVECKDFSRSLSRTDISEIKSGYEGVYEDRDISDLLIVSPHRLSAVAQSYVDSIPWLSFQTEGDLRNSIIDFRRYLIGVRSRFDANDVKNYHVPSRGEIRTPDGKVISPKDEDVTLDDLLLGRLRQGAGPMIILGDYGIGKTTLARELFIKLHDEWQQYPMRPIPIYISLELMQREQSLEGLLGTLFTSVYPCPGYNFDIFNGMNREGHFILILDGIDEMRHKLNKEEFLFNIDQISTLSDANSRTILLGRPSAFMDEEEYNYTVKGQSGGQLLARQSRVPHAEVVLELLETKQIREFVDKFCSWKYPRNTRLPGQVMEVVLKEGNGPLLNIARRPIQLMMLLEIFPELPKKIDKITKATVYSIFVDNLVERERGKQRSKRFSSADQRSFGRKIAFWLWEMGGRSRVAAMQIDTELFLPFLKGDEDVDDVRRALVAGSFLSTEGGTRLHFPHRSIQEFLIAEGIAAAVSGNVPVAESLPMLAGNCDTFFTLEIVDFLRAQMSSQDLAKLVTYFDSARMMPRTAASLVRGKPEALFSLKEQFERNGSVACLWLLVENRLQSARRDDEINVAHYLSPTLIFEQLEKKVELYARAHDQNVPDVSADVMSYILALFVLASTLVRPPGKLGQNERDFFVSFYGKVAEVMLRFGRSAKVRVIASKGRDRPNQQRFELTSEAHEFLEKVAANLSTHKIEVQWVYKFLRSRSTAAPFPPDWTIGDSIRVPGLTLLADFSHFDIDNDNAVRSVARDFRARFS